MGSKNLKAIAVKGSGGIRCADMQRIFELIQEHYKIFKVSPIGIARHRYGTPLTLNITHPAGMLPTRNYSTGQFERGIGTIDKDGVADATTSDRACYGCVMSCLQQVCRGERRALTRGLNWKALNMRRSDCWDPTSMSIISLRSSRRIICAMISGWIRFRRAM